MHDGFICDTCGFTSSEEIGTGNKYYCPECGSKMRPAQQGGLFSGGDSNPKSAVLIGDILYVVFVGGLSFGIMNYISYWTDDLLDWILLILWFILFVASLIWFHQFNSKPVTDKAIRKNKTDVADVSHFCSNCGAELDVDHNFCPNCGSKI